MSECDFCHSTEEFFKVDGFTFCGSCGRKLTSLTATGSDSSSPERELGAPRAETPVEEHGVSTPVGAQETSTPVGAIPNSAASLSTLAAMVRRNQQQQHDSPSSPYDDEVDSDDHVVGADSPVVYMQTPRGPVRQGPPSTANSPPEDKSNVSQQQTAGFHLSEQDIKDIEAAVFQKAEAALKAQYDAQILHLTSDNQQLQATLDETMTEFAKHLDTDKERRALAKADLEVLEAELAVQSKALQAARAEAVTFKNEHQQMRTQLVDVQAERDELSQEVQQVRSRMEQAETGLEKLKGHAGRKLQAAGAQYQKLMAEVEALSAENDKLRTDLQQTKERANGAESNTLAQEALLTQAKENLRAERENAASLQGQVDTLQTRFDRLELESQTLQARNEELTQLNTRHKESVVTLRGRVRTLMEEQAAAQSALKRAQLQGAGGSSELGKENQVLKSKLFDAMQVERQLRDELAALRELQESKQTSGNDENVNTQSVGNQPEAGGLNGEEAIKLRNALAQKEAIVAQKDRDNAQLVNWCQMLLSEVDALKNGEEPSGGDQDGVTLQLLESMKGGSMS